MHFKPPDQAGRPNFASDKTKRDGGRGKIDMHYNREAHGNKKGKGTDKKRNKPRSDKKGDAGHRKSGYTGQHFLCLG